MKSLLSLLLLVSLVGVVVADEGDTAQDPEALAILQKVDSAIKKVTAVRIWARAVPSGVATNFFSEAEGEAYMSGWNGSTAEKFYARINTKNPQTGDPVELTGGGDGDSFFLIDHTTKKGYEDMDPGVFGSGGQAIQGLAMIEFIHDRPFDDELGADKLELLGEVEVSGEPCYEINVVYAGGQGESTWLFSKNDFLPRGRIQKFTVPGQGEGEIERTITRLEIDPAVDPGLFRMKLPEGYEQIDDFAP